MAISFMLPLKSSFLFRKRLSRMATVCERLKDYKELKKKKKKTFS